MSYRFVVERPEELGLHGIAERLGVMLWYWRARVRGRGASTYSLAKEVRGALEDLLGVREGLWGEMVRLLPESYTPEDIRKREDREYFKRLLGALLAKYAEAARGMAPQGRRRLLNVIVDAVVSVANSPWPQACYFIEELHSDLLQKNQRLLSKYSERCRR